MKHNGFERCFKAPLLHIFKLISLLFKATIFNWFNLSK